MLDFNVLEQKRLKKGLTYEQLEQMSGFSKSEICRLINGKCKHVNWRRLEVVCKLLDVSIYKLIKE